MKIKRIVSLVLAISFVFVTSAGVSASDIGDYPVQNDGLGKSMWVINKKDCMRELDSLTDEELLQRGFNKNDIASKNGNMLCR